ncbi:MAG: C39 family peptidase [Pirellulales bacterium]|nr:C39 family peptidase [Pirellulales bacterium]
MQTRLSVEILPQPDDYTCGPTCLHAIYRYFGESIELQQVIGEVQVVEGGGTLAVLLGCHALARGYSATLYTYDLQVFDPTWFQAGPVSLPQRLRAQKEVKQSQKFHMATDAYLEFIDRGGRLKFEDLTPALLRKYLVRSIPILTGLSATFLHRSPREFGPEGIPDDVRGEPTGHFVVLCGYDKDAREVLVADPLQLTPHSDSHLYHVSIERVIGAILLGIVTYDANFLIIEPRRSAAGVEHAAADRRQ